MTDVVSRVVEVCVFRFRNDRPQYLLLKRGPNDPVYSGLWQIVTGTIRSGETAVEAARRELAEETAVTPAGFWVVPYTDSYYDPRSDETSIIPFFAAQFPPADEPRLSAEHVTYEWLGYAEALSRLVWPGQRLGLETVERIILGGEAASRLTRIPA